MGEFVKQHWAYFVGAILLHALFAAVFGLAMFSMQRSPPPVQLAIQAVVVDPAMLNKASKSQRQQREHKRNEEREQQAQRERDQQAQRERDQAAEKQRREQEDVAKREAEQKAEQVRQVEQKQREEAEQRKVAEEQQMRERQEVERKKAAADAEKQRQAEAERKRVAEIERKQKEEAERRKAADDSRLQQLREADLQKQLQEEEGEAVARGSPAMAQYVAMIKQQVERRWTRPLSAMTGLECEVRVAQTPTGTVLSVEVGRCNGDAAVRQSIETAVHRASPLPPPPDPRMFQRNLVFIFKPEA